MECFGTTDFDNNSRLITLSAIIISGLHCVYIYIYIERERERERLYWYVLYKCSEEGCIKYSHNYIQSQGGQLEYVV
jgi:hypothetical protein